MNLEYVRMVQETGRGGSSRSGSASSSMSDLYRSAVPLVRWNSSSLVSSRAREQGYDRDAFPCHVTGEAQRRDRLCSKGSGESSEERPTRSGVKGDIGMSEQLFRSHGEEDDAGDKRVMAHCRCVHHRKPQRWGCPHARFSVGVEAESGCGQSGVATAPFPCLLG